LTLQKCQPYDDRTIKMASGTSVNVMLITGDTHGKFSECSFPGKTIAALRSAYATKKQLSEDSLRFFKVDANQAVAAEKSVVIPPSLTDTELEFNATLVDGDCILARVDALGE
jgi:hypothetical protein